MFYAPECQFPAKGDNYQGETKLISHDSACCYTGHSNGVCRHTIAMAKSRYVNILLRSALLAKHANTDTVGGEACLGARRVAYS